MIFEVQIHVSTILTTMMAPGWTTDRGVDEGVVEGGAGLGQKLGSIHHRGHGVQEHILNRQQEEKMSPSTQHQKAPIIEYLCVMFYCFIIRRECIG